jgi:hypothetical protein
MQENILDESRVANRRSFGYPSFFLGVGLYSNLRALSHRPALQAVAGLCYHCSDLKPESVPLILYGRRLGSAVYM